MMVAALAVLSVACAALIVSLVVAVLIGVKQANDPRVRDDARGDGLDVPAWVNGDNERRQQC